MPSEPTRHATLLIECPDRRGLVAAISTFLYEHGANIIRADQYQDNDLGLFFMRIEWDLEGFDLTEPAFHEAMAPLAGPLGMSWRVEYARPPKRTAIFVSHYTHCLADLLHRHQIGELPADIRLVISNHEGAREMAAFYRVPFAYVPVGEGSHHAAEQRHFELLDEHGIELIVLARYMRILSPEFVRCYPARIINVHHSFLPAFAGARPYHAAFERGVKLIGATSHYVTEELDEGPIIEQDVIRVTHRDRLADMVQKGRDLERLVLSRALRWHLENRVLLHGRKTIVFD
jgi:formyltetrahydrofolate deformylase